MIPSTNTPTGNRATTVAPLNGDQPLWLHPPEVRNVLVVHDGTSEAEALGRRWATCFDGSVATLAAPAPDAWRTGPNSEFVARVEEVGADVVVVARDRRGGLHDLAGLSEYLLERLDLPVLACGADSVCPQQIHTILAPVDGTRAGLDALPLVLTLARAVQAEVVLLQVLESPPTLLDSLTDPQLRASGRALLELDQLKAALQQWGVSSRVDTRSGPVVASVASVAKKMDADLLAMSTHARTGIARTIHGSVAGAIARMVRQPILWVHTGGGDAYDHRDTSASRNRQTAHPV